MTEAELSWMTNSESVFPKDLDAYFMMRLGGFDYRMFDVSLIFRNNLNLAVFKFLLRHN